MQRKRYNKLFEKKLQEAFAKGSSYKVMTLLAKYLEKKTKVEFDLDIPWGYKNNLGTFRSYIGFFPDGRRIRMNFLLSNSDKIYSAEILGMNKRFPLKTYIFEETANIIEISRTLVDLIEGNIQEELLLAASRQKQKPNKW